METLTKEELVTLLNVLANANIKVSDAPAAIELFAKLQRMLNSA